ncbi:hypothetical protein [Bythopirellula polymerisocia]|uniref:Uncharacterized protein n=1 Tax=Bythopirellula polymerisocia TaxID=2528003 RepID=A0A5C6CH55_9BACT|nr:hypothetical protein [Bythopirellula polymerisocia]TWU23522.1 hypothetical protein Pla144_36970 [Bythopirellula polymerisocia]
MKKHLFRSTICRSLTCLLTALGTANCLAQHHLAYNLPPAQRLMEPGPGVGGPGPGVLMPSAGMGGGGFAAGASPAGYMGGGACPPMGMSAGATSQIAFLGVEGGEVAWDISGQQLFDSVPLVMPGRQNFPQGAIYRLKLTSLAGREGVELYPTLEVAPVTPRTDAYLAHSPIPVQFTDEDLDQVLSGNFVTKVIYLPDPEFQELALSGVETLVSTRLDPGVDPIAEADRRGAILAILRIGNLDLQLGGNQGMAMNDGVEHAQYTEGGSYCPDGGQGCYGGGQGGYGGMPGPQGMSTAGFAPQPVPPHMVSGMSTPQWGMPSVGTPIGLPGPPHIPLGHEAGLTSHVVKNHTRVRMPPPVHDVNINVKQRPGMNYPRPVNHVNISEVNRAGFRACGGTVAPAVPSAFKRFCAAVTGCNDDCECVDDSCQ